MPPSRESPRFKLSTGDMILEAVRRVQNPEIVRAALGDLDRVLDLSTDPLLRFQKVTLSPTDGYVLSRVDGTMSAREVVEMIPLPQEEVEKSLFGLLCTGVIEFPPMAAKPGAPTRGGRGQPAERGHAGGPAAPVRRRHTRRAAARRKDDDARAQGNRDPAHGDPRGLRRAQDEEPLRGARHPTRVDRGAGEGGVLPLAKRFHPDTHHDPALGDLGAKLEAVFIRLGEAYEVLRNPRTRGLRGRHRLTDKALPAARTPPRRPGRRRKGSPAGAPPTAPARAPPVDREQETRRASRRWWPPRSTWSRGSTGTPSSSSSTPSSGWRAGT